jgi:uroporphyrin-III C-methyltransferase
MPAEQGTTVERAMRTEPVKPAGRVALVGAGPGDPDLMTVRGLRLLRAAEVVVYDRLVAPALLDEAPVTAERVYVGKRAGAHEVSQPEINAILVALARRGLQVVRLKGGDPLVFGRGGEEAAALAAAEIPCEVVPGVSAALAAPAAAGIPLTHRGVAASFAVITGHEDPAKGEPTVDWNALAHAVDTLVVLMGTESLAGIARTLIARGRPGDTPVALIHRGTTPEQETVVSTLDAMAALSGPVPLPPPVTAVIGDVVALRARLGVARPERTPPPRAPVASARSRPSAKGSARDAVHGDPGAVRGRSATSFPG